MSAPTSLHSRDARKSRPRVLRHLAKLQVIGRLNRSQYRAHIRKIYDGPAGAMLALSSFVSLHEPLIGNILRKRQFDVTGCRRILDVGSGAGQILTHLLHLTGADTDVVAFDLSHNMLCRARGRVQDQRQIRHRQPQYVVGDLTQLPFADASFDCITCGWVIEHLSDPRPGLKEMARVLQPQGRLLLLATEDTLPGVLTSLTWKCRTYNRQELQFACEESGLPWQRQFWFTPLHRLFRIGGILVEAQKPHDPDPAVVPTAPALAKPHAEGELAHRRSE